MSGPSSWLPDNLPEQYQPDYEGDTPPGGDSVGSGGSGDDSNSDSGPPSALSDIPLGAALLLVAVGYWVVNREG
jgi:hypothetical protein